MQSLTQTYSDEQQQMINSIKPLPDNPPLIPSPYLWSANYISPAWHGAYGGYQQLGGDYYNSVSNQFNSAVTQPPGPPQEYLGGGRSINTDYIKKFELQGGMYGQNNPFEYNPGINPMTELYNRAQKQTEGMPIINKFGIKPPRVFGKSGRGRKRRTKK